MTASQTLDTETLVKEIRAGVEAQPDRKTAAVRSLRRQFSERIAAAPPGDVVQLALQLINLGDDVYRFMAYELVADHRAALRSLGVEELEKLGTGIDSWYDVDGFAVNLSGSAWREGQVMDAAIHHWAESDDRWWRRAALVSTVPLNMKSRGGVGDTPRTLAVCQKLVDDRDDMVVKAMSWALRELAKRDPDAVRGFLEEHEARLAARVVREVTNKLETGLKNP